LPYVHGVPKFLEIHEASEPFGTVSCISKILGIHEDSKILEYMGIPEIHEGSKFLEIHEDSKFLEIHENPKFLEMYAR